MTALHVYATPITGPAVHHSAGRQLSSASERGLDGAGSHSIQLRAQSRDDYQPPIRDHLRPMKRRASWTRRHDAIPIGVLSSGQR